LQWPSTSERKFKGNTEKMPFVITERIESLISRQRKQKKKNLLNWKERRERKNK